MFSVTTDKRVAFAIGVSWLSKGLSILASLLLVPTLFRYMSREELGLWYLIGNSQAFLGLLGFGLAPVLTRHIALLVKSAHTNPNDTQQTIDHEAVNDLIYTGHIALRWMAVATMLVSTIIGCFIISTISLKSVSEGTLLSTWILMCLGWSLQVWMSYLDCWVAGIGYVGSDTLITTVVTFVQTICYVISIVYLHGHLLSLACITLASVLLQRVILVLFLRQRNLWQFQLPGKWSRALASDLLRPSLRYWGTAVGAFFIYKTDQYFIALFLGTSTVALYQSTYNTVMSLALGAGAATSSIVVFASQMWAEGKRGAVHQLLIKGCRVGFIVLICGELFLLLAGKEFFKIWLNGAFIGYPILGIMLIALALDTQHGLLTNISRATDDEKYMVPALLAGMINLFLTWWLIKRIGIIGVPLGTLIAQALTNNWYGVYRPLLRLGISVRRYLHEVVTYAAGFGIAAGMLYYLSNGLVVYIWGYSSLRTCITAALSFFVSGVFGIIVVIRGMGVLEPLLQPLRKLFVDLHKDTNV